MLEDIGPLIRRLAHGESLTAAETRLALNTIGSQDEVTNTNDSDGFFFLAFTLGLMAKGPTSDELHGFVMSLQDQSVRIETKLDPSQVIDISGTGGDKIPTFNVGSTVAFILAAAGLHVAKQATRAYTGLTGSADVFQVMGVDPFRIDEPTVVRCLEQVGVAAFYTPAFSPGFRNRIEFLTKIRNLKMGYVTPWHLMSWVYSPVRMDVRLYGVMVTRYVHPIAEVFQSLGYRRVMVVHGLDGLDEVSNIGPTTVTEVDGDAIRDREISPEELGLPRSKASDIATLTDDEVARLESPDVPSAEKEEIRERGRAANLVIAFSILYRREKGPKLDLALANAGVALYLAGKASELSSGVALARKKVEDGSAAKKVEELAEAAGDKHKLRDFLGSAGLR